MNKEGINSLWNFILSHNYDNNRFPYFHADMNYNMARLKLNKKLRKGSMDILLVDIIIYIVINSRGSHLNNNTLFIHY